MNIYYTTQFKKDYKRIKKRGKDLEKLKIVIEKLSSGKELEPEYRDHQLSGKWKGHRDCHIESDWILIYRLTENALVLERTGSIPNYSNNHSSPDNNTILPKIYPPYQSGYPRGFHHRGLLRHSGRSRYANPVLPGYPRGFRHEVCIP